MVKITIDGREIEAKEKSRVLDIARAHNVYIPTLCAHESVSPDGTCRLCLVEVTNKKGKNRIVPSCVAAVEDGLAVQTGTEKVLSERKTAMEKLLARAPNSAKIKELGKKLGVESTPLPLEDHQNCVMCGLCNRICHEVVGADAIGKVNRNAESGIAPYTVNFEACIACGSCAYACPAGAITLVDRGGKRTISWPYQKKEFPMSKCKTCGTYWAPVKQIEYMAGKSGRPMEYFDTCMDDRK